MGQQLDEPLQVERPTGLAADPLALTFPATAVAVKVAVLELDPCALRGLRDKAHLDLAGHLDVRPLSPLWPRFHRKP